MSKNDEKTEISMIANNNIHVAKRDFIMMGGIDLRSLFLDSNETPTVFKHPEHPFHLSFKQGIYTLYMCQWCTIDYKVKNRAFYLRKNVSITETKLFELSEPALCIHCKKLIPAEYDESYDYQDVADRILNLYKLVGDKREIESFKALQEAEYTFTRNMRGDTDSMIHYDLYHDTLHDWHNDLLFELTAKEENKH